MKNRVPLLSQKPFQQAQNQIKEEKPQEQNFNVPVPKKKPSLNLQNKAFSAAIKKSWTTGAFIYINQQLQNFPEELNNIDEINLDGEEWWAKCPLKKIDMSNNQITTIPILDNLIEIQQIRLDSNKISHIPENFLTNLTTLKSLSLIKNNIVYFPLNNLFCPNLVELVISENHIQEFLPQIQMQQNLSSLEILDLRQNKLTEFPYLLTATKLKKLNCSENQIKQILTKHINQCPLLEDFSVYKNQINFIEPGLFQNQTNIKIIDFRENRLQEFTQELFGDSHPALDQIILSFNQIRNYTVYYNIDQLSILLLNNNKITQIKPDIIKLKFLKTLDLTNNDLSDLPLEMGFLPKLVRIQLEGNALKCIRPNLRTAGAEVLKNYLKSRVESNQTIDSIEKQIDSKGFKNQQQMSIQEEILRTCLHRDELIANNKSLPNICSEFLQISDLKVLDLSNNKINEVPNEINRLQKLVKIRLSSNQIDNFPFVFTMLSNLEELELESNKMQNLETKYKLDGFQKLTLLNLGKNNISYIPQWVVKLPNLQHLNMAYNKIPEIQNLISIQTPLKLLVLDLSNNQIDEIDDQIYYSLPQLNHLNLANNNLKVIPTILGFMKLKTIQIDGNPTKTFNRSVLTKGPVQILEYLRNKHPINQIPQQNFGLKNDQKEENFLKQQQQQYNQLLDHQTQYKQNQIQQDYRNFPNSKIQEEELKQQPQKNTPKYTQQEKNNLINQLNFEINQLENQIRDDFTLNNFQKQEKRRCLQQKKCERNILINEN